MGHRCSLLRRPRRVLLCEVLQWRAVQRWLLAASSTLRFSRDTCVRCVGVTLRPVHHVAALASIDLNFSWLAAGKTLAELLDGKPRGHDVRRILFVL